jgi:hypothetical protein
MDLADVAHAQSLATLNPLSSDAGNDAMDRPDAAVNVEKRAPRGGGPTEYDASILKLRDRSRHHSHPTRSTTRPLFSPVRPSLGFNFARPNSRKRASGTEVDASSKNRRGRSIFEYTVRRLNASGTPFQLHSRKILRNF